MCTRMWTIMIIIGYWDHTLDTANRTICEIKVCKQAAESKKYGAQPQQSKWIKRICNIRKKMIDATIILNGLYSDKLTFFFDFEFIRVHPSPGVINKNYVYIVYVFVIQLWKRIWTSIRAISITIKERSFLPFYSYSAVQALRSDSQHIIFI